MDANTVIKNVKMVSGVNVAAGVWLIAAPFVLQYAGAPNALWNHLIVGLVVLVLAAMRVSTPLQNPWMSWANATLGVWLVVAPFLMEFGSVAMWNSVIVGLIVAVLAGLSASAAQSGGRPRAQA